MVDNNKKKKTENNYEISLAREFSWSFRQIYNAIFKARIFRNKTEIRELANIGTLKFFKFINKVLDDKDPNNRYSLDNRQKCYQNKGDFLTVLKYILQLEYLERSIHGPLRDIPNELEILLKKIYPCPFNATYELEDKLKLTNISNKVRIDAIRKKIIEIISWFIGNPNVEKKVDYPILRVTLKYYFIFRAIQEEQTDVSNKTTFTWRKFKLESFLRAISYAEAGISIDNSKMELHLIKSRLFRELALFSGNIGCLYTAYETLVGIYEGDQSVIAKNCDKDEKLRDTNDHIAAASLVPDIFDDIGRVFEICFDILKTKPKYKSELSKEIDDLALANWLTIIPVIKNNNDKNYKDLLEEGNEAYKELIEKYFTISDPIITEKIPHSKIINDHLSKDWPDNKSLPIPLPLFNNDNYNDKPDHPIIFLLNRTDALEADNTYEPNYDELNELLWAASRFFIIEYFLKDDCFWLFKAFCKNKINDIFKVPYPYPEVSVNNMGRILCKLNKEKCQEYYREAIIMNPDYAPAHERLALFLLQDNQCVRAERHLLTAKELLKKHQNLREEEFDINIGEIIVNENESKEELSKFLKQKKLITNSKETFLYVLRRWNSYTPILPGKPRSLGGGYFLASSGKGVVIDPGYDFLSNFTHAGLSLSDIDYICVTHLHSDHIDDLENIIFLAFEQGKRLGKHHKLELMAGEKVIKHLKKRIGALEYKKDQLKIGYRNLNKKNSYKINNSLFYCFNNALHCTESDEATHRTHGLAFKVRENVEIGFTSDTKWDKCLSSEYMDCSVLVAHVGQVYPDDLDQVGNIHSVLTNEANKGRNHLGLAGIKSLIDGIISSDGNRLKLVIISEFGEELGAYRHKIASKFNNHYHNIGYTDINFLTGDIATIVKVHGSDIFVRCEYCGINKFRKYNEMSDILLLADVPSNSIVKNICHRHNPDVILSQHQHKNLTL